MQRLARAALLENLLGRPLRPQKPSRKRKHRHRDRGIRLVPPRFVGSRRAAIRPPTDLASVGPRIDSYPRRPAQACSGLRQRCATGARR